MENQFGSDVEYNSLDRGTPAWAIKSGPAAIDPIPEGNPFITVQENFDSLPLWNQITFGGDSGTGVWAVATDSFHSTPNSFKSPAISTGQFATFTMFNDTFDQDLIFWARVDGANPIGPSINGLIVKVDGVTKLTVSDFDTGWIRYTIGLNFGYQVDITYKQDFSAFTNRAWIDDIVFGTRGTPAVPGSPAHPQVYAPLHLDPAGALIVTVLNPTPTLSGTVPVSGTVNVGNIPHVIVDTLPAITQGTNPWVVSGTITIGTMPEVEIKNDVGNPVLVSGPLTDAQLRATPVPISGTVTVTDGSGPLTVDGTVSITGTVGVTQSTSPWVVSGPLTDTQLRATSVPVSGPLTDVQLRATPVPVSGTVTITDGSGPITVDGTVTVNQGTSPWVSDMTDRAARQVGLVDIRKASTVSTPAQTAITSVASTVLASNVNRRSYMIQNTGTVPVKLSLDGTSPTQTAYHLCLSPGTVADDGTGAVYMDDQWTGDVKAISPSAGTIVVTEVT